MSRYLSSQQVNDAFLLILGWGHEVFVGIACLPVTRRPFGSWAASCLDSI